MFSVIRIPVKFNRTIKRFSQKEKLELLDILMRIWEWETIIVPDNVFWDTINLIYWEWINMENKNWKKYEKDLVKYNCELPAELPAGLPAHRIEENRIEENKKEQFEIFWKEYPRKEWKAEAKKTFLKITDIGFEELLKVTKIYKQKADKNFYQHWSTYLNKKTYLDYVSTVSEKKIEQKADDWKLSDWYWDYEWL